MDAGQPDSALADMKESLALNPNDPGSLQLDGEVLMKMGRTSDAIAAYKKALSIDAKNRAALISLGYAERAAGNDQAAEDDFQQLAHDYPSLYVPWLALGDMYAERHQYKKAEEFYEQSYEIAPKNPLIAAGGINVGVERHDLALAGVWCIGSPEPWETIHRSWRKKSATTASKINRKYRRTSAGGRSVICPATAMWSSISATTC